MLLLLLLVLSLVYALFASPIAPWPVFATGQGHTSSGPRAPHPIDERAMPVSYLESAPRDKRLAAALPIALELRQALSGSEKAGPRAAFEVHEGAGDDYQVRYEVAGRSYSLELSARPEQANANLTALRALLDQLAPPTPTRVPTATVADESLIPSNTRDLLRGLAELDTRLGQDQGTSSLLEAAKLYAWQAFFKTAVTDSDLGDILATRALASYLAAGVQDPFVEALVWLGLDLPAPTLAALEKAPETQRRQLLLSFVKRDLETLEGANETGGDDPKLAAYLLARASQESGMGAEAAALIKRLAADHADFTHLLEYAASIRLVGVSNRPVNQYPLDLIETHLETLGELVEADSLMTDPELAASARRGTTSEGALSHWVELEAGLLNQPLEPRQHNRLFDMDLVKELLALETQDALYYKLHFEVQGLGRLPQASEIAQLIERAYPDSPLRRTAWLWVRGYDPEPDTRTRYRAGLSLAGADRRLLGDFILFSQKDKKAKGFPKQLDAMDALHALSDPARADLLDLTKTCGQIYFHGCARHQLELAMAVSPLDYAVAREAVDLELPLPAFDAYAKGIEHLPTILYLRARTARTAGDHQATERYLRQAIAANPSDGKPSELLATMLIDDDKPEQAIEVMNAYLEQDHTTMTANRFRTSIGRLMMEAGNAEAAYPILEEAARSGAAYPLVEFAAASERTGRELQAEQYYKIAAERYPKNWTPAELALFYLRQDNRANALQVLRTYRRYNAPDYFVKRLAKYAHEAGDPSLAIVLAQDVSESDWQGVRVRYFLANAFLDLDEPAAAAKLYGSLARDLADPRRSAPYTYAPRYLKASEAATAGSSGPLLQELIALYSEAPPVVMEYFGVHLLMEDMPGEAVPVFIKRLDMAVSRRADVSLLMAALAWREAGGANAEQQGEILARLQSFDDDWLATRVRFLTQQIDEHALLDAAKGRSKLCEAHYFLGSIAIAQGRRADAERHLTLSLQSRAANYMEYQYAYDLLRKLDDRQAEG